MTHALVVGPPAAAAAIVGELRRRGISAWSDRLGRVAADGISLDWADALVVIDATEYLEAEHVRPLVDYAGPSILAVSAPLEPADTARLIESGFDSVLPWPSAPEVIGAMVDRMLSVATTGLRRAA